MPASHMGTSPTPNCSISNQSSSLLGNQHKMAHVSRLLLLCRRAEEALGSWFQPGPAASTQYGLLENEPVDRRPLSVSTSLSLKERKLKKDREWGREIKKVGKKEKKKIKCWSHHCVVVA